MAVADTIHSMKNIKHFSLAAAVLALGFMISITGCGANNQDKPHTETNKEQKQHQQEHPDWATTAEAKVNQACAGSAGVAGTTSVHGGNSRNYQDASRTIAFMVTCKNGDAHMVLVKTPEVD